MGIVFAAMSGGVDSSVAAALLKKQGYEVIGVHMKCYNVDGCAEQDVEDARRAAEVLGIPFYVFDFEKEYKKKVVEYMVAGYRQGITPNPDVMCNKEIKFGLFLKKALEMGADYVATGHYVRLASRYISDGTGVRLLQRQAAPMSRPEIFALQKPSISGLRNCRTKHTEKLAPLFSLFAAKDKKKDQSYFLWTLMQEQLRHCLFPIGDYLKPEVRQMARRFGLPNAEKKDSQGICFLGKVTLKEFLGNYLPEKRGLILNTAGKVVGEHSGAYFYTIGQRSGLGLGGNSAPHYIAEKDVAENALLVAEENDPALYRKEVELRSLNFINSKLEIRNWKLGIPVLARVRYRQPLLGAKIYKLKANSYKLVFDKPQKFVAPGQSAVFYGKNGEMFGGGVILPRHQIEQCNA